MWVPANKLLRGIPAQRIDHFDIYRYQVGIEVGPEEGCFAPPPLLIVRRIGLARWWWEIMRPGADANESVAKLAAFPVGAGGILDESQPQKTCLAKPSTCSASTRREGSVDGH